MRGQNGCQRPPMPRVFQFQQRAKELLTLFRQRLRKDLNYPTAVQTTFASVLLGEDELLDGYRRGIAAPEECPLHKALASCPSGQEGQSSVSAPKAPPSRDT